jgi:predicted flap endonuclease-1-like 5' DNA nuclease
MAVRTIREAIDTHTRLLQQFDEQLKTAGSERTASSDLPTRAKTREVERLSARLEQVQKAREETLARFDDEIERLTAAVAALKAELELDLKRIQDATPGGGGTPARPTTLDAITGIGARRAATLKEAGIADVAALANSAPERIAELLRLSLDQAKDVITEARRLMLPVP